jgi:hypothetical protein
LPVLSSFLMKRPEDRSGWHTMTRATDGFWILEPLTHRGRWRATTSNRLLPLCCNKQSQMGRNMQCGVN